MDNIGDLSIGNLQSLIDNYEYLIRDLTNDIQTFQIEYSDLNSKIRNVVAENEKLSKDITYLIHKQQNENNDPNSGDSYIIENLKKQLNLIVSEKDYTMQLWQNAVAMIDHLEDELRIYQEGKKNYVSKAEVLRLKNECNSKIKELEEELVFTKTSLLKNTTINFNKSLEDDFLNKQDSSTKIIKNLEEEILTLQQRLKQSNKIKDDLTRTIYKQNKKIQNLEDKNKEYVEKVNEAVQVVEAACLEKDFALMRERDAKDEMTKVSKSLIEVIEQAETKLKSEVDQVKSDFNSNLKNVLEDLKKAHSDSLEKQNEINIYAKQCALLENEIERLQIQRSRTEVDSDKTSKLLILEKNLESTFQKLLTSEKENIILNAEISRMKSDMKDMIRHFETDIKTREIEKTSLQNKIAHMKNEINDGDKKYLDLLEQLETMKTKLLEMQKRYKEEMEQKESDLQVSHSEQLEVINKKNETAIRQLEEQLISQIELNQRWRSETKIIVAQLVGQIRRQKDVLKRFNQVNWNLKRKYKWKRKDRKNHMEDLTVLTNPAQIETRIKSSRKTVDT